MFHEELCPVAEATGLPQFSHIQLIILPGAELYSAPFKMLIHSPPEAGRQIKQAVGFAIRLIPPEADKPFHLL